MAANAKAGVEGTGGIDALRLAIDTQRRLSDEARGFADRIAITDVDHLGAVDRADLERLARRQLAMEGAVREVISSLAAQAGSASGQARDRFAQASRQLADGPALAEIGSADSALRGGRIAEAGEHQEQVLAALESIELAATGSNRRKIEDLERDLRALNAQLERQSRLREELTAKDQKQDQPATKRQQAEQREIAEALRKQAESQRRREDRQAKEASAKSGAARPKGSPPPGSERVAKAQQAAAKAAQQLAKDQRKEGEEAMREAMDALQQAQREMQQQVDQLRNEDLSRQPARTGTEPNRSGSKRGKMGSGLERGELAARKHRDWEVELEPQERETLAQGRGEAFPDRYDQALRQYYEALAGIGAEP
jgi:hypothetical protein